MELAGHEECIEVLPMTILAAFSSLLPHLIHTHVRTYESGFVTKVGVSLTYMYSNLALRDGVVAIATCS